MKETKRIEKELLFKNNIKDITSISLDSDYKVEKKEIIGNFFITGDYKIHEVSINREKFNFKIPFKHKIEDEVDDKTIKLEITNFEYDYSKDELLVNIEYDITGDREDVFIFNDKESLEDFLNTREVEVVDTRIDDIKQEISKEESKKELEEKDVQPELENNKEPELKKEINNPISEDRKLIDIATKKEKIIENKLNIDIFPEKDKSEIIQDNIQLEEERKKIKTDEIINNVGQIEDSYITYKVYTIKENETLESIVIKYHTTIDELKEYNDLSDISINDKIIIPYNE